MGDNFEHAESAFSIPSFRLMFIYKFCVNNIYNMLAIASGQYIFEVTKDPLMLGYAGLALFLPKFIFTLPAGHIADSFPKLRIIQICRSIITLILALVLLFGVNNIPVLHLYIVLFFIATFNAFDSPSNQAILPLLVPKHLFTRAVTWVSGAIHGGIVLGPLLAGLIYAKSGLTGVFQIMLLFSVVASLSSYFMKLLSHEKLGTGKFDRDNILAGVRYIFANKILLGAISMDLFAVLFGGAIALLPVFANDILHVGAEGLGILRASQSVGAALMAVLLARMPTFKNTGRWLFICVFLFGLGTIGFAVSTNFYLTLFFLIFMGAVDMVSVVVRGVLVQLKTPDEMRGRVSAVNMIFIGASNELGEFESGFTAKLFGTVPAAVLGGILTMVVVAVYAFQFKDLRELKALDRD